MSEARTKVEILEEIVKFSFHRARYTVLVAGIGSESTLLYHFENRTILEQSNDCEDSRSK